MRDTRSVAPSSLVALVDDHEIVDHVAKAAIVALPRLRLAGSACRVNGLLREQLDAGLVLLDLRLAGGGSSPATNVRRSRDAGSNVLAFTSGEDS